MAMIREAARSHRLVHRMQTNALINPKDLWEFFKEGRVPQCPLGTNEYKPFVYADGPQCPNTPDSHKLPSPTADEFGNAPK